MTIRKQNYAQKINELRNEIETTEKFMEPIVLEVLNIEETSRHRLLTKEEWKRVNELTEIIRVKSEFIRKATKKVREFYMPVSA